MSYAICPNCKERERSYDSESDGYSTHCYECSLLFSAVPYCFTDSCSRRICGTRTQLVNGYEAAHGAIALYACPNGCRTLSRIDWSIQSNAYHAELDVNREGGWLADCRVKNMQKILDNAEKEHPINVAGARAYIDTVNALRS